ncbi:S-adenosyl-L-methionine-dependent methyltransferase [Lepidopterella palustris CBS 459.81]|uniref:S-adenosyl-L-methionine-dependent methyltransferase n=1 Tax=Lepidopterella palustris CBS 459.81 TaxID=1314670 RepID=A0A8E2E8E9_9PEZI|nr:S-adenosyl-L-methionine-dependent methyltransferase [Lepidopterella palustris CBS 459.81]
MSAQDSVPTPAATAPIDPIPTTSTPDINAAPHDPEDPETGEIEDPDNESSRFYGPEPDSNPSDGDSALGDYRSTRSTSVSSYVYDYQYENGRRYHARRYSTEYDLPNDEKESDRLDLQHHLFLLTLSGALHRAPISKNVQEVLDVGTGTGIWAIDFADQYESSKVTGTDLSPIQPAFVPPNCQFYVDNMEEDWTFDHKFDYIHGRMIVVGMRNWERFFQQCYDNLHPGGWVEIQDLNFPLRCDDGTAGPESPPMTWSSLMIEGAAKLGVDLSASNRFRDIMSNVGFEEVTVEHHAWPINSWPKDQNEKEKGMWVLQNVLEGLQGFSMGYYTRGLRWRAEEVDVFLASVRERMKDKRSHVYLPIGVFYARKPMGI